MINKPAKILITVSLACSSMKLYSQNLVINPGFEDTLQCPYFVSQIDFAVNWHTSVNTPDYYNSCNNSGPINPGMVGVPNSARGYQPARTGNAFAGVVIYWTAQTDYREIFYAQLQTPLASGVVYNVGMYTILNEDNAQWAIDGGLGIYLSATPINPLTPFVYTPQVMNPPGNVLNDTLNWAMISGTYTATGGEQYITIGSFTPDNALTIINRGGTYPFTSYAIEDVWVIADSLMGVNITKLLLRVNVYPNPAGEERIIYVEHVNSTSSTVSTVIAEIKNLHGEIVFCNQLHLNSGAAELHLPEIKSGIYFLRISTGDESIVKKLVIN